MDTANLAYGVVLPLELKARHSLEPQKSTTATLSIVTINLTDNSDPTGTSRGTILSNPRDDSDPHADLGFRAYLSWETGAFKEVGWELEYHNVFSVDLAKAERMLKMLKRVRKAHSDFPIAPSGFAQYVALLGAAIGIKYMVTAENEETERRNHYPDGWYRIRPIRDAQNYVSSLLSAFERKYVLEAGGSVRDVSASHL